MTKLLRAGIRRYLHSIIFWLAVVVAIGSAVICGLEAKEFYFEDFYVIIELTAVAVMISWLVGRESEEGIFRNKVIVGCTKGSIYLSELILGVGTAVGMYLVFSMIFLCINSYIIGAAPVGAAIKIFIDCLLAHAVTATIFVTISCLIPRRAIIGIVNILLMFAVVFSGYFLQNQLAQNEYEYVYEYETEEIVLDDGSVVCVDNLISEHLEKNDAYVERPLRDIYEVLHDILPFAHISDAQTITSRWWGYDYYSTYLEENETWEDNAALEVTEEQTQTLNSNLIYIIVVFIGVCGIGYLSFRKKDLK